MIDQIISLLTPSRGRPRQCNEMMESAYENAWEPQNVEVVVRLDEDDGSRTAYNVPHLVGPRSTLSGYWNECADACAGGIMMQCADDIRFRTNGWDHMVRQAFESYPDGVVLVYGRDGVADERMATHGFTSRRWHEVVGFTHPGFSSDYGDLWRHTIARNLGRLHYLEELYTEHLHPAVGKAPIDETHRERMERDSNGVNERLWQQAQPELNDAVGRLAGLCQPLPTGR